VGSLHPQSGDGGRECADRSPAKNVVARAGSGRKKFCASVTGPEIFFTNRFCREFFFQKPEQPDADSRPRAVGSDLVQNPSSIVGTGGTDFFLPNHVKKESYLVNYM